MTYSRLMARRWLLVGLLLVTIGWGSWHSRAEPPSQAAPRTAAQQKQLAQAQAQADRAKRLWQQGQQAEAIQAWQQKLVLERAVWGKGQGQLVPSLQALARLQEAVDDFAGAVKALQEVLAIRKRLRGARHWQTIDARLALADLQARARLPSADRALLRHAAVLQRQAERWEEANHHDKALPPVEQALALRQRILGPDHPAVANSLNLLAALYQAQGRYAQSEPLSQRSLKIRVRHLGPDHPHTAMSLHNLALLYQAQAQYAQAEPLFQRSLKTLERRLGKDHPDVAHSLHSLALLYQAQGRYDAAEPLFRRGLQIKEGRLGPDHPAVAESLNDLALLYQAQGRYARARPLLQRSLTIKESHLGPHHPGVANSLSNLAALSQAQGEYSQAEPLFRRSLTIRKRCLGSDHPDVAHSLNSLAGLYQEQGQYVQAEPFFKRSLQIRVRRLGPHHPDVAASLNNLAGLYQEQGQYAQAEPLYLRSLKIRARCLGPDHPDVAQSLNNLALLYREQGQYARAEPLLQRSLKIRETRLSPTHPDVAESLNNLALLSWDQGRYAQAEPLFRRCLRITEAQLGKDHPRVARSLNNLAGLHWAQGEYGKAEPLFQRSLKIRERRLGPDHPDVAASLHDLAALCWVQGRYARAEAHFLRSLTIRTQRLGKDHPDVALGLHNLALLYAVLGRWTEATQALDRACRSLCQHLHRVLPALSPPEQLTYLHARVEPTFRTALTLALRRHDSALAEQSAAWLVNGKGLTQQALAEPLLLARAGATPQLQALLQRLLDVRQQLARLTLAMPSSDGDQQRRAHRQALTEREEQLIHQLGQQSGHLLESPPWVELAAVRQAIPADAVFINLVRLAGPHFQARGQPQQPARYVAWLIPPRNQGRVQVIDLGEARKIEAAVRAVREALGGTGQAIKAQGEASAEQRLRRRLNILARLVLAPLAGPLEKTPHWILSPDGALWLVPWAALPLKDGRYAIEKHRISHVVSGRDLLTPALKSRPGRSLVLADPDFDRQTRRTKGANPLRRGLPSVARLPKFLRLPGTAAEARAITPLVKRLVGGEVEVYTGPDAQEGRFKAVCRPRLLVLSTHGFFLEDQTDGVAPLLSSRGLKLVGRERRRARGNPVQVYENPLLRCGLALAGANQRAQAGPDQEDGILTGLEIVGTDLRGTELVVLSACETGLGQVNIGEGVAGLRQAFQLAGAQAVVATLWQIPDQETTALMKAFFTHLAAKKGKAEALRLAQLDIITKRRVRHQAAHPFYWAAFTLTGQRQ